LWLDGPGGAHLVATSPHRTVSAAQPVDAGAADQQQRDRGRSVPETGIDFGARCCRLRRRYTATAISEAGSTCTGLLEAQDLAADAASSPGSGEDRRLRRRLGLENPAGDQVEILAVRLAQRALDPLDLCWLSSARPRDRGTDLTSGATPALLPQADRWRWPSPPSPAAGPGCRGPRGCPRSTRCCPPRSCSPWSAPGGRPSARLVCASSRARVCCCWGDLLVAPVDLDDLPLVGLHVHSVRCLPPAKPLLPGPVSAEVTVGEVLRHVNLPGDIFQGQIEPRPGEGCRPGPIPL